MVGWAQTDNLHKIGVILKLLISQKQLKYLATFSKNVYFLIRGAEISLGATFEKQFPFMLTSGRTDCCPKRATRFGNAALRSWQSWNQVRYSIQSFGLQYLVLCLAVARPCPPLRSWQSCNQVRYCIQSFGLQCLGRSLCVFSFTMTMLLTLTEFTS